MTHNLRCQLPDGYIAVTYWEPHPCGGIYMVNALCWGTNGPVGRCIGPEGLPG